MSATVGLVNISFQKFVLGILFLKHNFFSSITHASYLATFENFFTKYLLSRIKSINSSETLIPTFYLKSR